MTSEYLTAREAAAILKCTPAGLARYRHERRGPPFLRVGKRVVRYMLSDLEQWLESGRVLPGVVTKQAGHAKENLRGSCPPGGPVSQ